MTSTEIIGTVASLLTVLGIGYSIGRWHEARRRRAGLAEQALAVLRSSLQGVRIVEITVSCAEVRPSGSLGVAVKVTNAADCEVPVWLGASLVDANGREYFQVDQDKSVILSNGTDVYRRDLTVPGETPPGEYTLVAAVWIGKRGHGRASLQLARISSPQRVRVV